jgi:cysteine desulfurase / selenocysteine lyase
MSSAKPLDLKKIREDFPILSAANVTEKPLIYLDSAATSQKPISVIRAVEEYSRRENASVHRGVYKLAQLSTERYESIRPKVAAFIGAKSEAEIIFTSGTTESINLVAEGYGRMHFFSGDVIAVTRMEHHGNFVPWQAIAKERGAEFHIIELDSDGRVDMESLKKVLALKPKLISISAMSNVTGVINPIREIATLAKAAGALISVDGAQLVAHAPVSIADLGPIDFFSFSGHKIGGPTGIGILWVRETLIPRMKPYRYGGHMIEQVGDQETTYQEGPAKFEAGTPNIHGVIGLGAAIDYLQGIGMDRISAHEKILVDRFVELQKKLPELHIIGPSSAKDRGAVFSFEMKGVHAHDLATFLDLDNICVRAGHHCCQPLLSKYEMVSTCRASFTFYNSLDEVDALFESLHRARDYFAARKQGLKRSTGGGGSTSQGGSGHVATG